MICRQTRHPTTESATQTRLEGNQQIENSKLCTSEDSLMCIQVHRKCKCTDSGNECLTLEGTHVQLDVLSEK